MNLLYCAHEEKMFPSRYCRKDSEENLQYYCTLSALQNNSNYCFVHVIRVFVTFNHLNIKNAYLFV